MKIMISITKQIIGCLLILLALNGVVAPKGCPPGSSYQDLFPSTTKIVASANYGIEGESNLTILALDRDDRVTANWFQTGAAVPKKIRSLEIGQAVWQSGDLDLKQKLPSTEVPIFATRLTNSSTGTRVHAVLTAFLASTEKRSAANKLYVFAKKSTNTELIHTEEFDRTIRVVLDDINDDGRPELAVEWVEDAGKIGGLSIWAISREGRLAPVKLPDPPDTLVRDFSTDFTSFVGNPIGPGSRRIIREIGFGSTGSSFDRRFYYRWDRASNAYKIQSAQEVKQIVAKLPVP